jgi:hypothetical protein
MNGNHSMRKHVIVVNALPKLLRIDAPVTYYITYIVAVPQPCFVLHKTL